jgi:hypothetical protein
LNKIGYQKTVFPIQDERLGNPSVKLVLNGYAPGLRKVFTSQEARLVALHVCSDRSWSEIRNDLVGGASGPLECREGSIRWDSAHGALPLDPAYVDMRRRAGLPPVDGQRNVCHGSATLLDGMRELCDWFGYDIHETVIGQLLLLSGVSSQEIKDAPLEDIARVSRKRRDDTVLESRTGKITRRSAPGRRPGGW